MASFNFSVASASKADCGSAVDASALPDGVKAASHAALDWLSGPVCSVKVTGNDGATNPRDQAVTVEVHNH